MESSSDRSSERSPSQRSISPVSEMSEQSLELERGPIRPIEELLPSPSLPQETLLRPSHEALLGAATSNDGLLRPSTEADRIDIDVTGRGRSGTTSSKKVTIAYGPLEGDDDPDSGKNILKKWTHTVTPVEIYQEDEERAINHKERLWIPWTLRIWTLVALICFFSLSIAVLEILSSVSERHNGLGRQNQSRRYLWVYSPCAVFFLSAAVWHQIKYRTQQLMPWRTMARGPAAASHSLLLDYISPWNIVSFLKSLKNGHQGVALVLLGSLPIKVVIIASTGLFSIRTTIVNQAYARIQSLEQFGGKLDMSRISTGDTWTGLRDGSGLVWPAFEPIPGSNGTQNVTKIVDVFTADLTCEAAVTINVTSVQCIESDSSQCDVRWIFNAITSSKSNCSFNNSMTWVVGRPQGTSKVQRFGVLSNASCDGNAAESGRLVITTGYLKSDLSKPDSQKLLNGTALICKPNIALKSKQVTVDKLGNMLASGNSTKKTGTSVNVTAMDIADAVWRAANVSAPLRSTAFTDSDEFVSIISNFRPELNLDAHHDLENGVRTVYRLMAAQIARTQLLVPAKTTALTSNTSQAKNEDRLFVNAVPLRIMEVALGLLILITAALCFARPAPSTPRDTSTIIGLATVMAQSPRYVVTMQGLAAASYATIKEVVSASRYYSSVTDIDLVLLQGEEQTFKISADVIDRESALEPSRAARTVAKPEKWWIPVYDLTRVAVLIAVFTVLMGIELLHQRSQRDQGLGDAEDSSSMRYAWTFVPAVVMLLLTSCIGIIDFATRLMQPYQVLAKSPVPAQRSISINHLSDFTVVAIWNAVSNAHFAVLFSAFAMLLAPFLTIVSTGLFVPAMLTHHVSTKTQMTSSINFNFTDDNATAISQLPFLANSIVYGTSSWPTWTNDTLVLPSLTLPPSHQQETSQASLPSILALRIPVFYANLECARVPTSSVLTEVSTDASTQNFSIPVMKGCGSPCSVSNNNSTSNNTCDPENDYVIFSSPLTQNGQIFGRVFLTNSSHPGEAGVGSDECPRIGILYGKGVSDQGAVDGLVAKTCSPKIYRAEANATFSLPSWTATSLVVDTSTEVLLTKGDPATIDLNTILAHPASPHDFDAFFTALVQSRNPIAIPDSLSESDLSTLQNAIQTLYTRLLAQKLTLISRSPTSPPPSLKASLTKTSPRLTQSTPSTRLLESLLSLILVCLVLATVLCDGREVVPNNPCSIAVMSSLIAGSEVVRGEVVPRGCEWMGDEALRGSGVFEGFLFSMGVWEGRGGRVFGIDVGEAGKVG